MDTMNFFNFSPAVALIAFDQTRYDFSEELTPFSICVELQNAVSIEASLTLHLQTEEGSAGNSDFMSIDEERSFNGSTCFEISIYFDDLLENVEFFIISMDTDSRDGRLRIENPEAEILIEDRNSKISVALGSI